MFLTLINYHNEDGSFQNSVSLIIFSALLILDALEGVEFFRLKLSTLPINFLNIAILLNRKSFYTNN